MKARVTVAHLFGEPAGEPPRGRRNEPHARCCRASRAIRTIASRSASPSTSRSTKLSPPTVTDDKGIAEFKLDLGRFTGRAYRLNVLARAFEAEGGRNVAAQNSAIVSDAPFLVGVKPDGDLTFVKRGSARQAHWLAVNQQLAPVAADGS